MFRRTPSFNETKVLAGIQQGGRARREAEAQLYDRYAYLVTKGQQKHHISEEQAVDAYADAVIAVVNQVAKGTFRRENKLSTLLYAVFFNKCVDVLRKKTNKEKWSELPEQMPLPDHAQQLLKRMIEKEQVALVQQVMEKLGKSCKSILWNSMYHGYSAQEIADEMGFKSAGSVMSQKSTCLKKLKAMLAKKRMKP